MNIQNKNSSKKVYAFYLAVAFFFTFFSFGHSVKAYSNIEGTTWTAFSGSTYWWYQTTAPSVAPSDFSAYYASCPESYPAPVMLNDSDWNTCFSYTAGGVRAMINQSLGAGIYTMYAVSNYASNSVVDYSISFTYDGTNPPTVIPPTPPDTTSPPTIIYFSPIQGYSTTTVPLPINFLVEGFAHASSTVKWSVQNLDHSTYYSVTYPVINSGTGHFSISTSSLNYSEFPPGASCGITPGSSCISNATTTLTDGFYKGTISITDSLGQTDFFESNFTIGISSYTGNYPPSSGIILPGTIFTGATSTTGLHDNNLLSWINLPNLLRTKFPFAYIPQIYSGIILGIGSTTVANPMPSGVMNYEWPIRFNLGSIATTTLTVDSFSTTTITYYLPNPFLNFIRNLMVAFVGWELISFLWHDVRRRHHLIS